MRIPAEIEWLRGLPDGAAWLDRLPTLVGECAERWGLGLGEPYEGGGMVSYVVRATSAEGTPVALKVQWPHRECEHEADALRRWAGDGAVLLLDHDPARHALLLEAAQPGTRLSGSTPELAVGVIISLMRRLSVSADTPFTTLSEESSGWVATIPREWEEAGRPFERALVDTAVGHLTELAPTQGPPALLHQDLHSDNVLAAEREPWLAIDPKPLVGEVEFAVAPLCRDYVLGHTRAEVRRRLDRACEELELDRERARGWAVGQTVAWAIQEARAIPEHVQTVSCL